MLCASIVYCKCHRQSADADTSKLTLTGVQVTMSSLVNALESAGQWQLAIAKFEELRAMGIRPNVICYNATISALAKGSQVPFPLCFALYGSVRS